MVFLAITFVLTPSPPPHQRSTANLQTASASDLALQGGGGLAPVPTIPGGLKNKALDSLLSAAGKLPITAEVGKAHVLELAKIRTAQMISDMMVEDVQKQVRAAQAGLPPNHPSLVHNVTFPALRTTSLDCGEFQCHAAAVHGGYPIQPPPISFLVRSLDRQKEDQDAAAARGEASVEPGLSLLTPEIRMHLQTQILAHIRVKADAADRYRSLLALAHVAEEEHTSRANSLDAGEHQARDSDGPRTMEVVVTAPGCADEPDEVFQTAPPTSTPAPASTSTSNPVHAPPHLPSPAPAPAPAIAPAAKTADAGACAMQVQEAPKDSGSAESKAPDDAPAPAPAPANALAPDVKAEPTPAEAMQM